MACQSSVEQASKRVRIQVGKSDHRLASLHSNPAFKTGQEPASSLKIMTARLSCERMCNLIAQAALG